jgi:hypothetical protein
VSAGFIFDGNTGLTAIAGKLTRMDISHFNDLLAAACAEAVPQRLLLVFAGASLPANATAQQQADFEAGESGELAPLMCVDKDPASLPDFEALAVEACTLAPDWALLFAAALSGQGDKAPSESVIDAELQRMVDSVKYGQLTGLIPFDRQGMTVQLG